MQNQDSEIRLLKRYPRTVLVAIVSALLFFLLIITEQILAARSPYNQQDLATRSIRLREHTPGFKASITPSDAYMRYTSNLEQKPYSFQIDSDGYIVAKSTVRHPDPEVTLVFLGGSSTECEFVEEEKRFPELSGRLLAEELGARVNSYNAGRSGNHTLHSLDVLLNKALGLEPDIVLLMHNVNDLNLLLYEGSYWNDHAHRGLIIHHPPSNSFSAFKELKNAWFPNLYKALTGILNAPDVDEFASSRGKKIVYDSTAICLAFQANLYSFLEVCRVRNIQPVLMTQANRITADPDPKIEQLLETMLSYSGAGSLNYAEYQQLYDKFNQIVRDAALKSNVPLIDLAASVPADSIYLYDAVHFNTVGSVYAAELVSSQLYEILSTERDVD